MHPRYSLWSALALVLLLAACSRESLPDTAVPTTADVLTKAEINTVVERHLHTTNSVYSWQQADNHLLWSALAHSQHRAAIGYQPAGFQDLPLHIHEIKVTAGAWKVTRDRLLSLLTEETQRLLPDQKISAEELLIAPEDGVLPILEVKILHPDLLPLLRQLPEVRYVEPTDYNPEEVSLRSDSGCDVAAAPSIPTADYTTIAPGGKVPWNYAYMNIPAAWSMSQGAGVTVCVIDTGTDPNQPKVGSQFASGSSTGRSISRLGTYVSSWWWWASPDGPNDQCGHGTQMSGLVAAPLTSSGSTVGVAYRANLMAVRGTGDVVINGSSEKRGVKDGLVLAGNRSDVKVISLSIGDVVSSSTVEDGIYYAYNRGKLIFAAAGTSLSWTSWWGVIFPANMAQTVAVTGIMDGSPMQRCNTCHSGSEVDLVAVMQRRTDNSRTSLTLARSGDVPSYVGGSSAATATTAGIAALVWATNTSQSRSQVLDKLIRSGSNYPSRDGEFGWGIVDAAAAVSGR